MLFSLLLSTGGRSRELQNVDLMTFFFMIFREIWSEHSPIDKEQKRVSELLLVAASNATCFAIFSIVELDRSIKR